MSNNKVKQWTLLQVADDEFYLDDGERPDCEYSEIKVMRVADHDRIVAELKAEYEQLQAVVTAPQMQYEEEIAELRAEVERLKIDNDRYRNGKATLQFDLTTATETIAKQKRVIKKLSEQKKSSFFTKEQNEKWAEEALDDATENDY